MRLGPRHSPLKAWLAVAGDRGPGPRPLAVDSADWPGSGLAPTCRNTDTHNLTKRASQTPSRCSSSRLLLCSLQWCTSYRERQCLGSMVFPQSFFFGGAGRAEALIGAPVSAPSSASSRWTAGDMTSSVGRGPDRSRGQPGDLSVDRPDPAQNWRIEPGRLQRRTRVDPLDPPRLGVVGKDRKRDQSRAAGGSDPRRPGRFDLGDDPGRSPWATWKDSRRRRDLGKFGLGLGGFDLGDDPGAPRTDQHISNPNPYWSWRHVKGPMDRPGSDRELEGRAGSKVSIHRWAEGGGLDPARLARAQH